MYYRLLSRALAAVTLMVFVAMPLLAQQKGAKNTHVGRFVSAEGNKFTMTARGGKEHSHTLAPNAKVIGLDGKEIKIEDLKKGQFIRVTTKEGDITTALKVEAIRPKKKKP